MENVSENMNSKKDEFKLYLRKNPSILIALVSAAVTIINTLLCHVSVFVPPFRYCLSEVLEY